MLILNFPGNPTSQCVELEFFERISQSTSRRSLYIAQISATQSCGPSKAVMAAMRQAVRGLRAMFKKDGLI
jgi:hypothetical protein